MVPEREDPALYACICAAVPKTQVEATILAGARTVDEISDRCGAGTGCGTCVHRLAKLLMKHQPQADAVERMARTA